MLKGSLFEMLEVIYINYNRILGFKKRMALHERGCFNEGICND